MRQDCLGGLLAAMLALIPADLGRAAGSEESGPPRGIPFPTLGGKQFWADELHFHGWRIQRNVLTEHCRLLDPEDLRHAAGAFEECRATLQQRKRERHLPAMHGKAVVLLHGLGDSRSAMAALATYLEERGQYTVFNVSYPSTRRGLAEHARALRAIVANLDGIEEVNFVGHSMGNLVVRHCLADQAKSPAGIDRRIGRMVMLGPPNHGAQAATMLSESRVFQAVTGQAGRELGPLWAWKEGELATPGEFAVIAGGLGNGKGYNPLLPGDDDGIVTVESTRLIGARDFVVVPLLHGFLPKNPKVHELTLRFLQHGYLLAEDCRHPIREDVER